MGKPYYVWSSGGGTPTGYTALDKKYLPLTELNDILPVSSIAPPDQFEAMLETSRILSAPFPHCRIDFLSVNGGAVIGEITLSPGALRTQYSSHELNLLRGALIDSDRLDDLLGEGRRIAAALDWPIETSFGHFAGDPRLSTAGQ